MSDQFAAARDLLSQSVPSCTTGMRLGFGLPLLMRLLRTPSFNLRSRSRRLATLPISHAAR